MTPLPTVRVSARLWMAQHAPASPVYNAQILGVKSMDNPNDSGDPPNGGADRSGICVHPDGSSAAPPNYSQCGGLQGLRCPRSSQPCVDDPRSCAADETGCCLTAADCLGICVGPKLSVCREFTGPPCPRANQFCINDPRDTYDPNAGSVDCPGICYRWKAVKLFVSIY